MITIPEGVYVLGVWSVESSVLNWVAAAWRERPGAPWRVRQRTRYQRDAPPPGSDREHPAYWEDWSAPPAMQDHELAALMAGAAEIVVRDQGDAAVRHTLMVHGSRADFETLGAGLPWLTR